MPAHPKTATPEMVAFVRRRYAAGAPVAEIQDESGLSLGTLYQCLDGVHDDGSGLPLAPLPRRSTIRRRRPSVRHVRATLAGRLWQAAELQVTEIEKRLTQKDLPVDEREGDARVFATIVHAMRGLGTIDAETERLPQPNSTQATTDDDPVPRDIDEFRRRLAEKIDRLAAAEAAERDRTD